MVNRKFLYSGMFLVAVGAVLLLAGSKRVDADVVLETLRLWPVVVIGLGVGLLLRGTRLGVAAGMLAAAMPGLLVGGLIVAAPAMTPECRITQPASVATQQGTFEGPASVDLRLDCGELSVMMAPGPGWQVQTGTIAGAIPEIDASADRLTVASTNNGDRLGLPWRSDVFAITLPTNSTLDLAAEVNAGRGRFDLAGARLGDLQMNVNAGEVRVDLTGATLARLAMEINAAAASVRLPAIGDFDANFEVNAGALNVCAPTNLGLRIQEEVVLGSTTYSGLVRNGNAWETPGYSTATHHADVTVSVNVGSVDINPEGGCK